MSTFLFKGFDSKGCRASGAKQFASKNQMEEYVNKMDLINYEIFESATIYKAEAYSLVSPKELSIFCKQVSVLLSSQINSFEGVSILAEQAENKQLKIALTEIHGFMDKGQTFAESMCMYDHVFTPYFLNMVSIGEMSGTLETVFSRMSDYYDKESKIRKKLKSAITYPAVLTALMTAIIFLLILKILPMFNEILSSMGGEMPPITHLILSVSTFIASNLVVIIAVAALLIIGFVYYIRTDAGRFWYDKMKLEIPALSFINSRVLTSRFARSLSILLKSGIQLLNALEEITALTDNKYLKKELTSAVQKVTEGQDLADTLAQIGIFPVLFLKMITIGQKSGSLDELLDKSADVFEDDVDAAIERLTTMIEPILIIILSVIVGIILISVMLPMISIMTAIG